MPKKKKSFTERLQELIDRHAGGVVRRFATAVGVHHQTVHNWLDGEKQPNAKALVAIWNVYRIDPLWLLTGEQRIRGPVLLQVTAPRASDAAAGENDLLEESVAGDRFIAAPLLSGPNAARSPHEIRAEDIEDFAVVYADWAPQPEMITAARLEDDAMAPILNPGSVVAIDHSRNQPHKLDGRLVAFRQGGGVAIRWCKFVAPDLVLGLPENHRGVTLVFRGEKAKDCLVGGVAWWWGRALE